MAIALAAVGIVFFWSKGFGSKIIPSIDNNNSKMKDENILGGVAGDDELFRRAPGEGGEPGAHAQLVVILARAHVVRRLDVDGAHVSDERLEYFLGLEAEEAILKVDVVGREPELGTHGRPELLVLGERGGRRGGIPGQEVGAEHQAQ